MMLLISAYKHNKYCMQQQQLGAFTILPKQLRRAHFGKAKSGIDGDLVPSLSNAFRERFLSVLAGERFASERGKHECF